MVRSHIDTTEEKCYWESICGDHARKTQIKTENEQSAEDVKRSLYVSK